MDMEMLVDMFTRMTEADRKQFAQMLLNKDEKLAREVASSWMEERNTLNFPLLKK